MFLFEPFHFPVSNIETYLFLPPLIMFLISSIVSPAGVSGAFILLPIQMSIFGYLSPGVSGTNFIYNITSIPLGAYQYIREKRISKSLLLLFLLGTVPGIFLGYWIRIKYLPNPLYFKIFVGIILFYLGIRCLLDAFVSDKAKAKKIKVLHEKFTFLSVTISTSDSKINYNPIAVLIPSLLTGVIGGAYGIGGGAIMAPYCVAVLKLPVQIVAGATLSSTWISSIIAASFYSAGPFSIDPSTKPDFLLGLLFGIGGMVGVYVGTKIQSKLPSVVIKFILGIAVSLIALKYIISPFIKGPQFIQKSVLKKDYFLTRTTP